VGIVTNPGYKLFGDNCLHRFPAGMAPKLIYISFTGIVPSTGPFPGTDPPPNGIWVLEQYPSVPCFWSGGPVVFPIRLTFTATNALLVVDYGMTAQAFSATEPVASSYFSNNNPFNAPYWQGSAFISSRPITDNNPSLESVTNLLNIERGKKTFGEIFPAGPDHAIYKFNRKSDKTNVLVKIDLSEF